MARFREWLEGETMVGLRRDEERKVAEVKLMVEITIH